MPENDDVEIVYTLYNSNPQSWYDDHSAENAFYIGTAQELGLSRNLGQ
jgi:hypothetical protein